MINGIGEKTVEAIREQILDLLETHKRNIQAAFSRAEDNKIKVAFGVNIAAQGDGLSVKTNISYTVEKVADEQSAFIKENQLNIFPVKDMAVNE